MKSSSDTSLASAITSVGFTASGVSAQPETPDSQPSTLPTALGAANALPQSAGEQNDTPSRWLKLADYGDWPHSAGLQRFTQPAAQRMAHGFKSLLGRLRRRFTGIPVYIGHPDDPTFAGQPGHDDTRAYAWVSNLEARPDGLHILARWSEPGRELLQHAFYKFLSPRWEMRPVAPGVFEPTRLLSIGLTNHPNIPGEAVANHSPTQTSSTHSAELPPASTSAEISSPPSSSSHPSSFIPHPSPTPQQSEISNQQSSSTSTLLPRLLETLELDPTAPPDALLARAETLANAARDTRDSQLEAARFYRLCNDAQAEVRAANSRADEERAARIELLLDLAELRGQTPPAERSSWRDSLQGDFNRALVALSNHLPRVSRPSIGASPLTARLATRRPGATHTGDADRLLTLVNERMAKTGEDYPTAWTRVKRTRADLFGSASTFAL